MIYIDTKISNQIQVKSIYPFITILYFMAKFVEMDERIKFKDQTEEMIGGPVILINKFNVQPDKVEQFLKDWAEDATGFKRQQGFVPHSCIRG
jgi:hypothetical protein